MKSQLGRLLAQEEAGAGRGGVVDLPRAVDSAERGAQVREHSGHADVVGLPRHLLQAESVANGLLDNNIRVSNDISLRRRIVAGPRQWVKACIIPDPT